MSRRIEAGTGDIVHGIDHSHHHNQAQDQTNSEMGRNVALKIVDNDGTAAGKNQCCGTGDSATNFYTQ
jgi:hypothetical protein